MKYRQASFRGVEFKVTDRSWSSGRRNHLHEYPDKDTPYAEDLGKKAGNYPVTAFVIGDDYQNKRDALCKACIEKGPGTLVHPDYGTVTVLCDSITVRESAGTQRMATIELVFIESGEQSVPETAIDLSGSVTSSAAEMAAAAQDSFISEFSLSEGVAELTSLVGNIADVSTSAIDAIGSGLEYAQDLSGDLTGAMNKLVDAATSASELKNSAERFLNTPAELASRLDTVFSVVSSMAGNKPESFATVRNLTSQSNASANASVANEDARAEKLAMQHIEQLTKQIVAAKEAEIITKIEFNNAEEATSVLESFVADTEEIELFSDIEPDNRLMQSLRTTREYVVEYIREIILELPRVRTIRIPEKIPSLALAYDLYEDLDRADEIVTRNKIPYPAFVPSGKDLKVLSE